MSQPSACTKLIVLVIAAMVAIQFDISKAQEPAKIQQIEVERGKFSIEVPSDWEAITPKNPDIVTFWGGPVDAEGEQIANVSVLYKRSGHPIDVQAKYEEMKKGLENNRAIKLLESSRSKVGNLSGGYFIYEQALGDIRATTYIALAARNEDQYLITCSTKQENFESAKPLFQRIISSFKVATNPAAGNTDK